MEEPLPRKGICDHSTSAVLVLHYYILTLYEDEETSNVLVYVSYHLQTQLRQEGNIFGRIRISKSLLETGGHETA